MRGENEVAEVYPTRGRRAAGLRRGRPGGRSADQEGRAGAGPKPNCYATFWTWLDSSAADCPLTYWGITFYGQVDVGGGYETTTPEFNPDYPQGVQELISKQSHGAAWQAVPNGLSQSNVGVKWKEQIAPDWFFIGDVNFGFDPYSLRFADGPRSLVDNNTTPAFFQDGERRLQPHLRPDQLARLGRLLRTRPSAR